MLPIIVERNAALNPVKRFFADIADELNILPGVDFTAQKRWPSITLCASPLSVHSNAAWWGVQYVPPSARIKRSRCQAGRVSRRSLQNITWVG